MVVVSRNVGHYDLCHPKDTQANIRVSLPDGAPRPWIGACVDVDSQYDVDDGEHITDVIAKIEAYGKRCLYSGDYQRDKEAIDWAKEHELEVLAGWYECKLEQLRKVSVETESEIKRIHENLQAIYDEIKGVEK